MGNRTVHEIIEAAIRQADEAVEAKAKLAEQSTLNAEDIFAGGEDVHENLAQAAQWFYEHSDAVTAYDVEPAAVRMDLRAQSFLEGEELRMFTHMTEVSRQVFISGIHEGKIRFVFT